MKNMETTKKTGDFGENIARAFLESKGYTILAQNFRFKRREIDIIVCDNEYIVFIEVKTRTNIAFSLPSQSVSAAKQNSIISAAQGWLFENETTLQPRFDVIEIYRNIKTDKNYVRHIQSAFILTEKNTLS